MSTSPFPVSGIASCGIPVGQAGTYPITFTLLSGSSTATATRSTATATRMVTFSSAACGLGAAASGANQGALVGGLEGGSSFWE